MVRSTLLTLAFAALSVAAPATEKRTPSWEPWQNKQCSAETARTRVSFASMPADERKAYVDAISCIHSQPSNLDNAAYPAAVNRYQDYAVVHVNRTSMVHLSGFFLTWHRQFLALFEHDLRHSCGYNGRFPYWDFSAANLEGSVVFDGSASSIGSNGAYNNTGPIALGPQLVIPHGSGGGCLKSGPFSDWTATLGFIDPLYLASGTPLPANAYAYNASCLRRDLNAYVAQTYTSYAEVSAASHAASAAAFELALNGVIGGSTLGVHSGAHFTIGGFMNSIHVSVQDPVWWMLHANVDRLYASWQLNNPSVAHDISGTMTANNMPPSANVTLETIEPSWGYFKADGVAVKDLVDTMAGPFCYQYDQYIS